MKHNFAVIDCETTGFTGNDRILEFAVVLLDSKTLDVIEEFDTLINPLRDVGPTAVHGVTASMVSAAPTFDEIAGHIASRLNGNILVAHNISFDSRFLENAFERTDIPFDLGNGYCTLKQTKAKLGVAAGRFNISIDQQHRALTDARATAGLFKCIFEEFEESKSYSNAKIKVPAIKSSTHTLRREAVGGGKPKTVLARLLAQACYPTSKNICIEYFEALDWVLADGIITAEEQKFLNSLISKTQITIPQIQMMHAAYFASVHGAALRDSVISELEHKILNTISKGLGLQSDSVPAVTKLPRVTKLKPAARICFTGEALDPNGKSILRENLEALAAENCWQPVDSVTKKNCDLLVAADPSSGSGKAQKARAYGLPIICIADFLLLTNGK